MVSNLSFTAPSLPWLDLAPNPVGRGVRIVSAVLECGFATADKSGWPEEPPQRSSVSTDLRKKGSL